MNRYARVTRPVLMLAVLLALAPIAAEQSANPADFTGTWVASTDAPQGAAAAPSPVLGPRFALRLEGDTLAITRPMREESIVATYKTNGSRTSMRIPGRMCEGDSEFIETVAWEGSTLVLAGVGRIPPGGGTMTPFTARRLLRLQGPDALLVESTMSQGGATRQVATVYKKSNESLPPPKPQGVRGVPATIAQVGWITGFWSGESNNQITEERWTSAASGGMLAIGRRLRGNLMSSFEFLCISERNGSLVYTALPDGRTTPTFFTLTAITADSATFENPDHDFPKMVRYTKRPDGSLEATISGAANQRSISFVMQRKE